MKHDLRVGRRREDRSFAFESLPLFACERKISVVANRYLTVLASDAEGLRLENRDLARCRITYVANRTRTAQSIEVRLIEGFGDVTHGALEPELGAVRSDNATRFLTAMLKRVQTEVGQSRCFGMSIDSEDTTLFT